MLTKVMVAVVLMVSCAVVATAQSRFTVSSGESGANERGVFGLPMVALEIVTGRMQFRAEMPLSTSHTDGAEIGVAYNGGIALELAGNLDDSRWLGTLDLRREPGISGLRITPGVAWNVRDVRIGIGVALPSARERNPSLVLSAAFEF